MSESKYAQLLDARVKSSIRRTTTAPVCLDPALWEAWEAAKNALDACPSGDDAPKTGSLGAKPSGRQAAEKAVQAARAALREASILIHYRALLPAESREFYLTIDTEAPATDVYGNLMRRCFTHATTLDGETIADIDEARFSHLVDNMELPELEAHNAKLNAILGELPDFPM